jgi:hypothetical protein
MRGLTWSPKHGRSGPILVAEVNREAGKRVACRLLGYKAALKGSPKDVTGGVQIGLGRRGGHRRSQQNRLPTEQGSHDTGPLLYPGHHTAFIAL